MLPSSNILCIASEKHTLNIPSNFSMAFNYFIQFPKTLAALLSSLLTLSVTWQSVGSVLANNEERDVWRPIAPWHIITQIVLCYSVWQRHSKTVVLTFGWAATSEKHELVDAGGGLNLAEISSVGVDPALLSGGDIIHEHARSVGKTLGQTRLFAGACRAERSGRSRAKVRVANPRLCARCFHS